MAEKMNIRKYEIFLKVTELGSITRAAEALETTQSGVSHAITTLEEDFGFTLFTRSRNGVTLTDAGERIIPTVRAIINYNERLEQTVASIHGLNAGTVRIGTFTSVAVHWLPGMIKSFQDKYPNIEFRLLNGDYYDVDVWLSEGAIDIGFVTLPFEQKGCEIIPLAEDRLLAILPPEHPLAGAGTFPIEKARSEPFIGLLESSDHDARRALEAAGIKPNLKFSTKDDYAILAMVENGLGMSIVPELLISGRNDRLAVLPLDPPATRTLALAVASFETASPATKCFAEHVKAWVGERFRAVR